MAKKSWFGNLVDGAKAVASDPMGSVRTPPMEKQPAAAPSKPTKEKQFSSVDSTEEILRERGQELKKYKKGGKVNATGPAIVHKGERVLNTKQTNKLEAKPQFMTAIGVKVKPNPVAANVPLTRAAMNKKMKG